MTTPNRRARRDRRLATEVEVARRRLRRGSLGAASLAGAALVGLTPGTAAAAVTSTVTANVLTVNSDLASDSITVTCGGDNNVKVNGADPNNGAFACSSLTQITVNAGEGNDTIDLDAVVGGDFSSLTSVNAAGGGGRDRILTSQIPSGTTLGEGGADTVLCGLGCDCVIGGAGPDSLVGGPGEDDFDAGPGNDTVLGKGQDDDFLYGQGGHDLLMGGPGNDQFFSGGPGNDTILAGPGSDDDVFGDDGRDLIRGGAGGDNMFGGYGGDDVLGEGGTDLIFGDQPLIGYGEEADTLSGGLDGDEVWGQGGVDRVVERANTNFSFQTDPSGTTLVGGSGSEELFDVESVALAGGGAGNRIDGSRFEGRIIVSAAGGPDTVIGTRQRDQLNGGPGNDRIMGKAGRDRLLGQAGADRLLARDRTRDTVSGGAGNDLATVDPRDVVRGVEQQT
jgi:Ca2+-binding RTX toxin-like protein